ncbi:hypothetical protein [Nonomuraea jabiensis]|uniref:Uncharacterized protein n=1 Tax=Nonomuraea jabiensis TaxID=882448 RepID=A0A7W9LAQ2_9ACTN|nr:hypothetical protein [Nonomuraea jabiensis]MBB5776920.1 hypothetical protein [Nonomuraea jabiensis]
MSRKQSPSARSIRSYMPDKGQSMYTLHGLLDPEDTDGLFPLAGEPRTSLYGDLPDAEAEQAASKLVGGHSPFLSQPRRLAALIDEIGC